MYRWIWKLVVAVAAMVAIASTSWAQDEESTTIARTPATKWTSAVSQRAKIKMIL